MRRAQTAGGIVIPGNIPDPQAYGRVMSIGEFLVDTPLKEGDIVVMHLNAGMDMVMERNLMRTVKYEEIYGILEDKDFEKNLEDMIISGSTEGNPIITAAKPLISTI